MKAGTLENGGGVQRDRDNTRKLEMRVNEAEDNLQAHLTWGSVEEEFHARVKS